ncbi:MAG: Sir2 family NAD-dependent protein deacetylase [Flavihumibacter sp.]
MPKNKLVVLTGAGISAESGLKTFRDSDGLWEGYDVGEVATPRAWAKNPELVLRFYNERRRSVMAAQPNSAHTILAGLEKEFDVCIITQNIDDLHERAGSSNILHLHGEILSRRSEQDEGIRSRISTDMHITEKAPDGGRWRPDIVWFEEPVPKITEAVQLVKQADIFVVVGTSLQVYPAAGLVDYVPDQAPIFLVDRKMPPVRGAFTAIIKPATEGMAELAGLLRSTI